jgi:hypothetical protein
MFDFDAGPRDLADICRRLQDGQRYGQANFGDGEWAAVFGESGTNCDGSIYNDGLGYQLRRALKSPKGYFRGLCPWWRGLNRAIEWVNDQNAPGPWVNKEILSEANWKGRLGPFLATLRQMEALVVCNPETAVGVRQALPAADIVTMPGRNAWAGWTLAVEGILKAMHRKAVVCFSVGFASNLLIHDLWDCTDAHLIDTGAIWDPYAGIRSRKKYREDAIWDAIRTNLAEAA